MTLQKLHKGLKVGSINSHRNNYFFVGKRFIVFLFLFGTYCKFHRSCSPLHSFFNFQSALD